MQFKIPIVDKEVVATVKWRKHNNNGKTISIYNENLLLDMRLYKFDLSDVAVEELSAKTIA